MPLDAEIPPQGLQGLRARLDARRAARLGQPSRADSNPIEFEIGGPEPENGLPQPDVLRSRLQQLRDARAGRINLAAERATPEALGRMPSEATATIPVTNPEQAQGVLQREASGRAETAHQEQLSHLSSTTRAIGFALGAGRGTEAVLTFPAVAAKAAVEPAGVGELENPFVRGSIMARSGAAPYNEALASAKADAAKPGGPGQSQASSLLNPLPLLDRIMRGIVDRDPEVLGELAGMVAAGDLSAVEGLRKRGMGARPTAGGGAPDAFATLGLDPRVATPEMVDAAYRDIAKRTHPDITQDPATAAAFHAATEARQAAHDYLESVGRTRNTREPGASSAPQPQAARTPAEPTANRGNVLGSTEDTRAGEARDLGLNTQRSPEEEARFRELTRTRPAPIPEPSRTGAALHDAEGQPIPGTEVSREQQAAAVAREAGRNHRIIEAERRKAGEAPTASASTPPPASIISIPTHEVLTDPARFQFKGLGPEGVSGEMKGVKTFNPELAGVVSVWEDPKDRKTYVVNGHHRVELAKRLGQPQLNVQYIKAPNATAARAKGALMNIAEGRGTATDVAKFLRDTGTKPEDLAAHGISLKGDLAKNGVALSRLAPDLFDQVATGAVPQSWGVAIGELIEDPALQREALKAVRSGKRLTQGEVVEVARQVRDAGTEAVDQESLFGKETERHGLFVHKAHVATALKRRLSTDRRLFGYVSQEGRATELGRAGRTQIDVAAARDIADVSARAEEIFDRLYTRTSPLADIVTAAARRLAHGDTPSVVVNDAYPRIRDAVGLEIARGEGGVSGVAGRGDAVPEGARAPADEGERPAEGSRDSTDVDQGGFPGVREPLIQDDLFGKPKLAEPEQTEMLPANAGIPTAKLKDSKIGPDEIARVRREGGEPEGARPADLFAEGQKSAVAEAAKQIADAVKAALKPEVRERPVPYTPGETIKSAAVKVKSGKVYEGEIHVRAQQAAQDAGEKPEDAIGAEPGYVTSSGRFVGDAEAIDIAERSGLITHDDAELARDEGFLPAEDLPGHRQAQAERNSATEGDKGGPNPVEKEPFDSIEQRQGFITDVVDAKGSRAEVVGVYHSDTREIYIENIGDSSSPVKTGVAGIRDLFRRLHAAFPDAQRVVGERFGTTGGEFGRFVKMDLRAPKPPIGGTVQEEPQRYDALSRKGAPEQHADLAFGSVAQAKAAAVAMADLMGDAAQYDFFGAKALDPEARRAAVARADLPHAWVTLEGQRIGTPEDLHKLVWAYRDPRMERLHFILTDDAGKIVAHEMYSSGAMSYVRMKDLPAFLHGLAERTKPQGATTAYLAHNHPSGNPAPSRDDIKFTGTTARALEREGLQLAGHYVIDDETGQFIEHLSGNDTYRVSDVVVPRAHTGLPDWTETQGAQLTKPGATRLELEDILAFVSARALPEHRLDVLYMNPQAYPVAFEPHAPDALRDPVQFTARVRSLAASAAYVITGSIETFGQVAQTLSRAEGLHDVLYVWQDDQGKVRARSAHWEGLLDPNRFREESSRLPAHRVFERPIRSADSLRGDDQDEVASRVSEDNLADASRRLFSPTSRSPEAGRAGNIIRQEKGLEARDNEAAREALHQFRGTKLSTPAGLKFVDDVENGRPVDPKRQKMATLLRGLLDAARAEVQGLGTGKLEHFIQDYFPHIWEKPDQAVSIINRILGKRPLEGPKSFLKQRTIPTIAAGIRAGLKPAADDVVDMVLLKLREMNRYIAGQRIIQEYKRQGLVQFVRAGKGKPDGFAWIDDPIGTVYGPFTDEGATTIRGRYAAPEPVATVLNQHLSPGLRGNAIYDAYMHLGNTLNQVQLGLSAFHLGFVTVDAITSQSALGLEQIVRGHPIKGVANAATMWAAPFTTFVRGSRVIREYLRPGSQGGDLARVVDDLTAGGGRVRMDSFYKNNALAQFVTAMREKPMQTALKGLAGGMLGGVAGGPAGALLGAGFASKVIPAVMEFTAKPLMEFFVPRMKVGVFADLARWERSRLPADATDDQVRDAMAKVWDSVDNRMGQLVYDNLFWHRATKDALMASTRALGWNLGTVREIGGGTSDILRGRFTHRAAYVFALPFAVGILGAVICYLYTGHGPRDLHDVYRPPTGRKDAEGNEERVQLPSYMKDIFAFASHPWETAKHKLNPLVGVVADLLENENFFGGEVRNPNDPLMVQVQQVADYLIQQFQPIGISNLKEQQRRGQSGATQALPFVGITPAPREAVRSPAQNLMAEYTKQSQPAGATPEQSGQRKVRAEITDAYRAREITYREAGQRLRAAGFTAGQVDDALRRMKENPVVSRFKQLTLEQAREVYKLGTPEERDLWGPTMFRKETGGHVRRPPGMPTPPRRARR